MDQPQVQTTNSETAWPTPATNQTTNTSQHPQTRPVQKQARKENQTREKEHTCSTTERSKRRPKAAIQNPQLSNPKKKHHQDDSYSTNLRRTNTHQPTTDSRRTQRPLHHNRPQNSSHYPQRQRRLPRQSTTTAPPHLHTAAHYRENSHKQTKANKQEQS